MKINEYKIIYDENNHPKLWNNKTYQWKGNDLKSYNNIAQMLNDCYKFNKLAEEHAYVLAYHSNADFLGLYEISHNNSISAGFNDKGMFEFLLLIGADGFIKVHNHPSGNSDISNEDFNNTSNVENIASMLGLIFNESLIIAKNRCITIKDKLHQKFIQSLPNLKGDDIYAR